MNNVSCSNNTNKLSPQEPCATLLMIDKGSNNTNKLSPQEQGHYYACYIYVQIIQINLVLKNKQTTAHYSH